MGIQYQENRYPALQRAVSIANATLRNPQLYERLAEIKKPFSASQLNGEQLAPILKKHVDLDTPIYVKTYYPSWWQRTVGNGVNAYVNSHTPSVIYYNSTKTNPSERAIEDMAATIVHEYVHCADTLDPDDSYIHHGHGRRYDPNSAPYVVERIAYELMSGAEMPRSENNEYDWAPELPPPALDPLNYIAVGDDADYATSGDYRSSRNDVIALADHVSSANIKNLVIYFHDSGRKVFTAIGTR